MTIANCDVIIIGSGPAGVSAAFPLVNAGYKVMMLDGGMSTGESPPTDAYDVWRRNDSFQHNRMIGSNYYAFRKNSGDSPKLRVPLFEYVFKDFLSGNKIEGNNFSVTGSLASGGLSNAWGAGVATFSRDELKDFPCPIEDLYDSYESVAKRIGISGGVCDDMSSIFGVDSWSKKPVDLDHQHAYLLSRYSSNREYLIGKGFRMGRTRLALLTSDFGDRKACNLSGNCLWGCSGKSLYSAVDELAALQRYPNFVLRSGNVATELVKGRDVWSVRCTSAVEKNTSFDSPRVILAAGTLATTALVLRMLNSSEKKEILTCPTAAFMLWIPSFLGAKRSKGFGSGQLAFNLDLDSQTSALGATFSTGGIPVTEFAKHLPIRVPSAIDVMRGILSSCVVGNLFLPGRHGKGVVGLSNNGVLKVSSSPNEEVDALMKKAYKILSVGYLRMGAIVLPGSFRLGKLGGDMHYSGSLPMRKKPRAAEVDENGELFGCPDLYVVDGACLPFLSEKPHTFTIMANADRISRKLVGKLKMDCSRN